MLNSENSSKVKKARITNCCPDFDEDCQSMNSYKATWCFLGCHDHPCCSKDNGIGVAQGYCPMLHKTN